RQGSECIFEDLLKPEELEHGKVHRGVKSEAAFVRADGRVELHAVSAVYVDVTFVIRPRYAEGDDALRLHEPLKDSRIFVLRGSLDNRKYRFSYLLYRLEKLRFVLVPGPYLFHKGLYQCMVVFS